MKRRRIYSLKGAFFAVSTISFLAAGIAEQAHIPPARQKIKDIMIKMTPEEKIGQLMIVGIPGKRLRKRTQRFIQKHKLGGIILYKQNIKTPRQVRKLVEQLQSVSIASTDIPLFISVDQEGGSVARIRKNTHVLPSAMAIGATRSPQFSFLAGKITAFDLSSMGINMNLAPVLDVNTEAENHAIGTRSFGDNPELVAQLGMWYIEGLQSRGIIATAKHFPGHGTTKSDSHYLLPVVKKSLDQLERTQLMPFQRAIDNGLDAIMTAHISIPSLDPAGLPATLSYNLLTNVIRKKMNFKGIILTDDLEMKAIHKMYTIGEAAVKAVLAGADIVMVGWTAAKKQQVFNALLDAYRSGVLSQKRIDASVKRILSLKMKRRLFKTVNRKPTRAIGYLKHPIHKRLSTQIASNAITIIKSKKGILPLRQDDPRHVLLVTSQKSFYKTLGFYHNRLSHISMVRRPTLAQIRRKRARILARSKYTDLIIIGMTHHSQIRLINEIANDTKKPVVVVSFGSPYVYNKLSSKIASFICSYGTHRDLLNATARVITGLIKPRGKLPVNIPSKTISKRTPLPGVPVGTQSGRKISAK